MLIPRLASSLVLGLALASVPALAQVQKCDLKLVASIPAKLVNDRLLLETTVNGTPATIELDTGAAVSTINKKFAQGTGMTLDNMPGVIFGLTDRPLNEQTTVHSLQLGNRISTNEAFAVMPVGGDGTDGGPVGLFGSDYLQNYDVEIDAIGGKVNLFDQEHCIDRVVYWAREFFKTPIYFADKLSQTHRPMMDIEVEGKPLRALLDTGAGSNFMRLAVAERRFDLTPDTPDTPRSGTTFGVEGRTLDVYTHVFHSLAFGELTLHNTTMRIIPVNSAAHEAKIGSHIKTMESDEPDAVIGMSFLRQLHIYISYSEKALYYTIAKPKQAAAQ